MLHRWIVIVALSSVLAACRSAPPEPAPAPAPKVAKTGCYGAHPSPTPYRDCEASRFRIRTTSGYQILRCNPSARTGERVTSGQRVMVLGQAPDSPLLAVVTERGSYGWLYPHEIVSIDTAANGTVLASGSRWGSVIYSPRRGRSVG